MNIQHFAISVISYFIGFLSGFFVSQKLGDKLTESSYKTLVLVLVSVMWTISVAFEIVNPAYKTNPMIHGLMGSIVGFFYTLSPKVKK